MPTTDRPGYLAPSPAGAYFAVAEDADNRLRRFLRALLACPRSPQLSEAALLQLTGFDDPRDADRFLAQLEELGWIQYLERERVAPDVPLENLTDLVVRVFSGRGKCLLADAHGFAVACLGFADEVAEELAALSADLATLHERHQGALNRNLNLSGSAWALANAAGHSQIGFWPLYIGEQRFVLVIQGVPLFNRPQLVELVWALFQRYGSPAPTLER